jgi:hypothetical protein
MNIVINRKDYNMQTIQLSQRVVQEKYQEFYEEALKNATPNEVTIGIEADGKEKLYKERNFYFCGFNNLLFKAKTAKNRELRKVLVTSPAYGGGFSIRLQQVGNRGNGDFNIQQEAYHKVASFLKELGYDVDAESRLD